MRFFLITIVTLLLVCACGEEKRDDFEAAKAAKEYYDHLLAGRYVEYLDGMADADSIPPSYREQLLANAKQFMTTQRQEHGDITSVNVVSARTDSISGITEAFLLLSFNDSTKEEVIIPMTQRNGHWLMK